MKKLLLAASLVFFLFSCSPEVQTLFLDEMDLLRMESGWGNININKTVDGNPLQIAGVEYERGLGTHAIYKFLVDLQGDGRNFKAKVGVDDESGEQASVEFMVLGDREVLWNSGIMKKGDPAMVIDLSIKGIKELALYVSDGGDNINYDHVDWIDARFEYQNQAPVPVVQLFSSKYILTPPESDKPRINGPVVLGANPGNPFIYRVPVTGKDPITLSIKGLPDGLHFNPDSRVISGIAPPSGFYPIHLTAENSIGAGRQLVTIRTDKGLALTPPLGWNSWNCWGLSVDQGKVKAAADAMVESGLADHGWSFINIDDGWEADQRTAAGELLANDKFPNMKELADYCHDYGLKLGIYSSPGPLTCGGYLGSYKHELLDIKTWANWGIDYVKYDWCGYSQVAKDNSLSELQKPYAFFTEQLNLVSRDIIYSICQYGMGDIWEWGEKVGGNLWRTTGDITDTWNSMASIGFGQGKTSSYAGPGHWNDPDMLVVGQVGWGPSLHASNLSPDEQYTHISLWSLLAAPLLIGCDMTQLDDFTLSLLTNDEVLAVNQDTEGEQAVLLREGDGVQVWVKHLAGGYKAVGLFYTGENSPIESFLWDRKPRNKEIQVSWEELGITGTHDVRDVWRQQDLGNFKTFFSASVPYHGVVLVKITGLK